MATERVVIQFRADGTRVVTASIKGVGAAAKKASKSTDTLKRALQALIALETARRIIQLADSFTLLQNRIRVLTDDQEGLVRTTQSLFDVANRTRTSIESNALIFQRLTLATKGLVSGEEGVLEIVETLNKALKISGTTTQEAAAGTIQLAQGFAAGALRGDELRSVMEQLPIIASILAKELGVTRGGLRKLGKEGLITSEILVRAFQNNKEAIEEAFGKVIPTISDQFVILRNNIIQMIGDLEAATGIFRLFADSIGFVAENLKTFAQVITVLAVPAVIALTKALAALAGAKILVFLGKALVVLKFVAAAVLTFFGAILTILVALIVFNEKLKEWIDFLSLGNRQLRTVEKEVDNTNKGLLRAAKIIEDAAEAAALYAEKVADVKDQLEEELVVLGLSTEAQAKLAEQEKFAAVLKEKGIDLIAKGTEEQRKSFEALRVTIKLASEEAALLRKLEGPLAKINRERATARRLIAQSTKNRELLLKVERQRFAENDKLIRQLELETQLLKENSVVGAIANEVVKAGLALQKKGIDLSKLEGQLALAKVKTAIEDNRAAAIRRQNLRDFNIDQSERIELEKDLGALLFENASNEKVRNQILKELNIEQAKNLLQLGNIDDIEFDKVIERTLEPLRVQNELLRAEGKTLGQSNVERAIAAERLSAEISLRRKGLEVTRENIKAVLDENEALKRQNALMERRKALEREFGIDQTAAREREAGLNDLLAQGNANFDQRVAIMAALNETTAQSTDFLAGLKQGFLDIDTSVLKLGMDIGGFLIGTINGAADALAEFAVGGFQDTKKLQQALSDLFRQLAKDIIAATIRMIIFRTIQAALTPGGGFGGGGGGGGVDTGVTNVTGGLSQSASGNLTFIPAQAGAFLQAGQPAIVGERGPEPFVPTASGRVLPNAAMAEAPAPQVTIVNVTDPKEVQAFLSTTEGEDVIMNVIQKRNRQVRGLLK